MFPNHWTFTLHLESPLLPSSLWPCCRYLLLHSRYTYSDNFMILWCWLSLLSPSIFPGRRTLSEQLPAFRQRSYNSSIKYQARLAALNYLTSLLFVKSLIIVFSSFLDCWSLKIRCSILISTQSRGVYPSTPKVTKSLRTTSSGDWDCRMWNTTWTSRNVKCLKWCRYMYLQETLQNWCIHLHWCQRPWRRGPRASRRRWWPRGSSPTSTGPCAAAASQTRTPCRSSSTRTDKSKFWVSLLS